MTTLTVLTANVSAVSSPTHGGRVPADPSPAGASSRPTVLTVRPHEVDAGDILVGFPRKPIAVVLLDCGVSPASWLYYGFDGYLVARRSLDAAVQVIRGATPGDECPPYGLERPRRHLEAVR